MIEVVSMSFSNGVLYFFKTMRDLRAFLTYNKLGYFKDMKRSHYNEWGLTTKYRGEQSQYLNLVSYKSHIILKAYKLAGNPKEGAKYRLEVLKNEV